MEYQDTKAFALAADSDDTLAHFREQFLFPKSTRTEECIYLCGNSLGLQPRRAKEEIDSVLENWSNKGVEAHFDGDQNWIDYNDRLKPQMAQLVGAKVSEIAIMNTLSVNLHLLLISFYQPTEKKYKILIEADAFPSDKYIVHSQVRFHGYDPQEAVVEVKAVDGGLLIGEQDVKAALEQDDAIALVLLGGINYFTGQYLPLEQITQIGHEYGCVVGFDLAHAVGNVQMDLHGMGVDFAAWCNYKYVNGGPGAIASIFIHEKHHNRSMPRLEAWWGNDLSNRFLMKDEFTPAVGAEAWVMSTPPTLSIAPIKASLQLFEEAGFDQLRQKSIQLTGYLEYLLYHLQDDRIQLITPKHANQRGAQLSIRINGADKSVFDALIKREVIVDWREPDIIRVSPAPFYNRFIDVYEFVQRLKEVINQN